MAGFDFNERTLGYIYLVRDKDNFSLTYVGSTVNPENRFKEHRKNSKTQFWHIKEPVFFILDTLIGTGTERYMMEQVWYELLRPSENRKNTYSSRHNIPLYHAIMTRALFILEGRSYLRYPSHTGGP